MEIETLRFIPARGGKGFVGLRFSGNKVEICYPESFRWANPNGRDLSKVIDLAEADVYTEFSEDIQMLLRSLMLAKKRSDETKEINDTFVSEQPFALQAYLWMVRDYLDNGMYVNREKTFEKNRSGQISWKKTMRQQPMISGNSIVFQDYIAAVKSPQENLLVEIYRFCLKKSIYLIGWLFNISAAAFGIRALSELELAEGKKQQYIYAVTSELHKTFDNVKQARLKNMLRVLTGLNKSENGALVFGVKSYAYVFECLVDSVFGTDRASDYYPHAAWRLSETVSEESEDCPDEDTEKETSKLRPDSILIRDGKCVIIDSKLYRFPFEGWLSGKIDGLPGTSSIMKQIVYGDQIYSMAERQKLPFSKKEIYNCFVIPFDKTATTPESSELVRTVSATASWWRPKKRNYDQIIVFLIDMRSLLRSWSSQNYQEKQRNLIEQITSCLKKDSENLSLQYS